MKTRILMTVWMCAMLALVGTGISSCRQEQQNLPILSPKVAETNDGKSDTVYQTIPYFNFRDQNNEMVTPETFYGRIYVADFFFTSCPTICPLMKKQMQRVYKKYKGNKEVAFLSHTIDPRHDSVEVLKAYARPLDLEGGQWYFVTGDRDAIYDIAQKHYMVSAQVDENQPGGLVHGGLFILVDKFRRIRGYYDGTNPREVNKLIDDISTLLDEE